MSRTMVWACATAALLRPLSASAWVPGDLNGDGDVNVTDVQVSIQLVLASLSGGPLSIALDANQDGIPDAVGNVGTCLAGTQSDGAGGCVVAPCPATGSCDDGIACTIDACDAVAGCTHDAADLLCDDGVPCTADGCDPSSGCEHAADSSLCDDGEDCTFESCDLASGCIWVAVDALCDDGNACTIDTCRACPKGLAALGSCYEAFQSVGTWIDARDACEAWGGHLVTIADAEEDRFVRDLRDAVCGSVQTFIGLQETPTEGVYFWLNGEPLDYANWGPGQPDDFGGNEVYGTMLETAAGSAATAGWNDVSATYLTSCHVCEMPQEPPHCDHAAVVCEGDDVECTAETCDPVTGSCVSEAPPPTLLCPPTLGPGCASTACEACVCMLDPLCCAVAWDEACADCALGGGGRDNVCVCSGCQEACTESICDDGSPLTEDACDPAAGCQHWPASGCRVRIPAGPFWMGCNGAVDANCKPDEYPQHEVTLSAYEISQTEITTADYMACFDAGLCDEPGIYSSPLLGSCNFLYGLSDDPTFLPRPINCVSWFDAKQYCESMIPGGRLCTEAEWEKAARGGCEKHPAGQCASSMPKYPWGDDEPTCNLAVMKSGLDACGTIESWPAGSKPSGNSPYGVADMAGNLWEFVGDRYAEDYYYASPDVDPVGPAAGIHVSLRGGAYFDDGQPETTFLRASARAWEQPGTDWQFVGMRCCRTAP